MEQRISVLTIGPDDLNAMKNFYGQILGSTTVAENKDIAFYSYTCLSPLVPVFLNNDGDV